MEETHRRLSGRVPDLQGVSIVHGDFRLDNVILSAAGQIAAVVDWELHARRLPHCSGEEPALSSSLAWRRRSAAARQRRSSSRNSAGSVGRGPYIFAR